jgi:Domain of unknown function (DUF4386)
MSWVGPRRRAIGVNATTAAAVLLIVLPVLFNGAFAMLAARFDYPDILRRPTDEVLDRFRAGGSTLILIWWVFAMSALLLAPLVVLLSQSLVGADARLIALGTVIGVLATLVQVIGLVRWPFLVPYLARVDAEPGISAARREAVDVIFQSFNRYLGVAVGEHLGYGLTGAWSILAGADDDDAEHGRPGVGGRRRHRRRGGPDDLRAGVVGGFEPTGWKVAAQLTPVWPTSPGRCGSVSRVSSCSCEPGRRISVPDAVSGGGASDRQGIGRGHGQAGRRRRTRDVQPVALARRDSQVDHHSLLSVGLDALGEHDGIDPDGQSGCRPDHRGPTTRLDGTPPPTRW